MKLPLNSILVVGASLAGVRAAETLRREGFNGQLILAGAERHFPPFDRPPLSKEVLQGTADPEGVRIRVDPDLHVDLRLGEEAVDLSLARREVRFASGSTIAFDGLVIATGAAPRPFVTQTSLDGVYQLRSIEDSITIRDALSRMGKAVVIGAGFMGGEIASVCRSLGIAVTVVEAGALPMQRVLGMELGKLIREMYAQNGVELLLNSRVTALEGADRVERVVLDDGTRISADMVIAANGARPTTNWLASSGLILDDGVVLDEMCMAVGVDDIVAAGDVARWRNPLFDRDMRVEHWSNAVEQGEAAAHNLLAGRSGAKPFCSVPYFWSEQHGVKIQFVGIAEGQLVIDADDQASRRLVGRFVRDGRTFGGISINSPRDCNRLKRLIASDAAERIPGQLAAVAR